MKIAVIISYILIIVLAIVVFMQWCTIQKIAPASDKPADSTNREVSASDWTRQLSDSVKNMTVDLNFK